MARKKNTSFNVKVLLPVALGVAYLLVYWWRLLLDSRLPLNADTFRSVLPSWIVGKNLLLSGFHLLWDPYRNMGIPFLATPSNQALYPLRFLSVFVDFIDYQRVALVFHTLLLTVFSYLLVKRWTKSEAPAWTAALAMGFNGFVFTRMTAPVDLATLAWVPALLFVLDHKRPMMLGVLLTLQWMAGQTALFLLSCVTLLIFCTAHTDPKKNLLCFGKAFVWALGLSAVQLLPYFELLKESLPSLVYPRAGSWANSVHPNELFEQLLIPAFWVNGITPMTPADRSLVGFYVGPVVFGFFCVAFARGQRREKILGGAVIGSLFLSLGVYLGFYEWIPFMPLFESPARWLLVAITFMVLLAALGLHHVKNKKVQWLVLGVMAADFLIFAGPLKSPWVDKTFLRNAPPQVRLLPSLEPPYRIYHSDDIRAKAKWWRAQTKEDWLAFLRVCPPSIAVADGWREVASQHDRVGRRHQEFLLQLREAPSSSPLFDEAGVRAIFQLKEGAADKLIPTWEDAQLVVKDKPQLPLFLVDSDQTVQIESMGPGWAEAQVEGPGQLVFSEVAFPGWRVQVDRQKKPIRLHQNIFPSVQLEPGSHRVRFHYFPMTFLVGFILSIATLVVGLPFLLGERLRT